MPVEEAYQQAALNGCLASLVTAAGGSLTLVLLQDGTELSGNGYARKSISTIPDASAIEGGFCTVRLITDTLLTASGGNISWNQLELRDSTGTNVVFPRFSVTGIINSGESKKVAAVFGLPDSDGLYSRVANLETAVDTLESDVSTIESDVSTISGDLDDTRFGVGDGLQAALTSDKENDVAINLAEGTYNDSTTLNIINGTGGGFVGRGKSDIVTDANTLSRSHSTRMYTGSKTAGTAHILQERSQFHVSRCNFFGKSPTDIQAVTGTNTPIGWKWVRASGDYAGIGTGNTTFFDTVFAGYDVAMDRGSTLLASNCDRNSYYNVTLYRNGTGFRSHNVQGLSDKWYNLEVGHTDTVFDYLAGGKLEVYGALINHPCTFLQLRNDTQDGFGTNASRWTFNGIDLDSQAVNTKLLDCEAGAYYYAHIVFDGIHFSRNSSDVWTNYCWNIGDNMHVTINNAHNLMAGMIKFTTTLGKSSVTINGGTTLEGSVASATDLIDGASTGSLRLNVNNLMKNNSQDVITYNSVV